MIAKRTNRQDTPQRGRGYWRGIKYKHGIMWAASLTTDLRLKDLTGVNKRTCKMALIKMKKFH